MTLLPPNKVQGLSIHAAERPVDGRALRRGCFRGERRRHPAPLDQRALPVDAAPRAQRLGHAALRHPVLLRSRPRHDHRMPAVLPVGGATRRSIRRSSSATMRCGSRPSATSTCRTSRRRPPPTSPPANAPPKPGRAEVSPMTSGDLLAKQPSPRPRRHRRRGASATYSNGTTSRSTAISPFRSDATFFPSDDPVAEVLAAFSIFAVGYLMRPVGAIAIGYIGDRAGRPAALTFSILGMVIPDLPGWVCCRVTTRIGLAAPILLTDAAPASRAWRSAANWQSRSSLWSSRRRPAGAACRARSPTSAIAHRHPARLRDRQLACAAADDGCRA